MTEKKTIITDWIIKNGKPVPTSHLYKMRYNEFIKGLKEGDRFVMILEQEDWSNTKPQLAKIHAMIKEIAIETGEKFNKTKENIKERSGLTYYENKVKKYRSFARCSKEELSAVIEILYELGQFLNINFEKNL